MYFSSTLVLFSAIALSSAIPTNPRRVYLFPRQSANGTCPNGAKLAEVNPEAAAEAHQFDRTADRPQQDISIKTSDGTKCLTIDPECGDFRHNLIPVQFEKCVGNNKKQKFDIVTNGKHIDQEGGMLVVSRLVGSFLQSPPTCIGN